jgi:hypothetical protein
MLENDKRCPSVAVARVLIDELRLDDELAERLVSEAQPDTGGGAGGPPVARKRDSDL